MLLGRHQSRMQRSLHKPVSLRWPRACSLYQQYTLPLSWLLKLLEVRLHQVAGLLCPTVLSHLWFCSEPSSSTQQGQRHARLPLQIEEGGIAVLGQCEVPIPCPEKAVGAAARACGSSSCCTKLPLWNVLHCCATETSLLSETEHVRAAVRRSARGSLAGLEDRGHLATDRDARWDADRVGRALDGVNYTEWEEPSEDLIAKHRKRRVADFNDTPIEVGTTNMQVLTPPTSPSTHTLQILRSSTLSHQAHNPRRQPTHLQGMEIPDNHPFIDTNPDSELTDEVVAARLNAGPRQQRRRRGPAKAPLRKTSGEVNLVMTEEDRTQAALEAAEAEAVLRGVGAMSPEASSQGGHLGLGALGSEPELSEEEVEDIKRRAALRARRNMLGTP